MKQYEMFELVLNGMPPEGSQAQVEVEASFTVANTTTKVAGFYDGNGVYKVRFYPSQPGAYRYSVTGVVEAKGEVHCQAADSNGEDNVTENVESRGQNHGMVHEKDYHFQYEDGSWFYPFGTTIYALIHQEEELICQTMDTLKKGYFNKVRFCVFHKDYDFNHNDPKYYPFEKENGAWNVHKPCFAYWQALEKRIQELDRMGIQGDMILFHPYDRWGFASLSMEESLVYLDYLLRRLSAFPNLWWSMANEYDLMGNYSWENWVTFAKYIKAHDAYGHLLSNHNCFGYWDFTMPEITHCSIQDINMNEVPELQRKYHKPVVFDECRYEGNIVHSWGSLSAKEMTHRFWTAVVYGGYCTHGETYYSDDDILWWAKGGTLKGESPVRIGFLKSIMEELPGPLSVVEEGLGGMTIERIEQMKIEGLPQEYKNDFMISHMISMPKERLLFFLLRHRPCLGCYEDKAFLRYFEKECTSVGIMNLPANGKYRVEVIDTWEMTRKVVEEAASGFVKVSLPGKEGMAMLATLISKA